MSVKTPQTMGNFRPCIVTLETVTLYMSYQYMSFSYTVLGRIMQFGLHS